MDQGDEDVIRILTSQVLQKMIDEDVMMEKGGLIDKDDEHVSDSDQCDASSVDLDENKVTKESPLKRKIDLQHQIN